MKRILPAVTFAVLLPAMLLAQTIQVEALKPQFDFAGAEPSTFTTAWFVTATFPLLSGISLVGQVPFAFGKLEDATVPTEDEAIGNPAVGLRFHRERLTIDVAVRVPIVESGFAGFIGSLADIERQDAFVPDIVPFAGTIRTKVNYSKLSIHPYGGAIFTVKTKHEKNDFFDRVFDLREDDGELFVIYGAEGWLDFHPLHVGAALSGRTWVSSGGNFKESAIHQLSFRARLSLGKFEPGVLFRLPMDDILLDNVIGVELLLALED